MHYIVISGRRRDSVVVEAAVRDFDQNRGLQFRMWWDRLDRDERLVYAHIAQSGSVTGKDEFMAVLGGMTASDALDVLCHTGVIARSRRGGGYTAACGMFKAWYLRNVRSAERRVITEATDCMGDEYFDVFLAHNSKDKREVSKVCDQLRQRGLKPWIDKEQIRPGEWFQDAIQEAIPKVRSAAVFIGPHGVGRWQVVELRALVSACVEFGRAVIPVLLPGIAEIPDDLRFLRELHQVKLRSIEDSEGVDELEWGIRGGPRL